MNVAFLSDPPGDGAAVCAGLWLEIHRTSLHGQFPSLREMTVFRTHDPLSPPARLLIGICFTFLLVACVEENFQRQDVESFLSDYDPSLKIRRDQLVATILGLNTNLSELRSLEGSYRHEQAKTFVRQRIAETEAQKTKLAAVLRELDARIEVAMASRQIDAVDSGGLESRELEGLMDESGQAIADADEVLKDISSLFNSRLLEETPPAVETAPSTDTSNEVPVIQAKSADIQLGQRFDVIVFPSTGTAYHDVIVTNVESDAIRIRHQNGLATISHQTLVEMRLGAGSGGAVDPSVKSGKVRSKTGWAIVHAEPSSTARAVQRVSSGERLLVAPPSTSPGWCQVLTRSGARGWMPESALSF